MDLAAKRLAMTFDATWSIGSITSIVVIVLGIGGTAWKHTLTAKKVELKVDDVGVKVEKVSGDLAVVRTSVQQLTVEATKTNAFLDAVKKDVRDLEDGHKVFDGRLREIEKAKR